VSRSGKIALWVAAGLAVVLVVFLIAIAVGQGLGQASVWATVLGLPIGLIGAAAGVLALVVKPATRQPIATPEPLNQQQSGPLVFGPSTLARLATTGVRGQSVDAWAVRRDGTVRHWWWPREDGSPDWSAPEIFRALPDAGGPVADMAAASRGPGHAEVFAVDRHGSLWHRTWLQGEGWAEWREFTGQVAGPVAACSFTDSHIEVLIADQDHRTVKHNFSKASATWGPWTALDALNGRGAAPLSRLTAVGVRGKWLDAWALREDGKLSHSWWPRADGEQTWSEPEDFAAPGATVDIAAASRGPGHAEIFAVDRTGNLWHRWWLQGEGWVIWQRFTSGVASPVAACSFADGQIQVFVTDPETNEVKYSSSSVPATWDPWKVLG
jgi:hypothetical protein